MSGSEVMAGLVERVTFHNAETGFCVVRVKAQGQRDRISIVGHAANPYGKTKTVASVARRRRRHRAVRYRRQPTIRMATAIVIGSPYLIASNFRFPRRSDRKVWRAHCRFGGRVENRRRRTGTRHARGNDSTTAGIASPFGEEASSDPNEAGHGIGSKASLWDGGAGGGRCP